MLLPELIDGHDLISSIEIMAQDSIDAYDALIKIHNRVATNEFALFLRFCDTKGLQGGAIPYLLFKKFAGEAPKFVSYVLNSMPCLICQKVLRKQTILNRLNEYYQSVSFFLNEFKPFKTTNITTDDQLSFYDQAVSRRFSTVINSRPRYDLEIYRELVDEAYPIEMEEAMSVQIIKEITIINAEDIYKKYLE
jgi:hypothetical protein